MRSVPMEGSGRVVPRTWRISQRRYLLIDAAVLMAADIIGLLVRFEYAVPLASAQSCMQAWPFTVPARILVMSLFGMYQRLWKYSSVRDMTAVAASVTMGYVAERALMAVWPAMGLSRGALLISYLAATALVGLSRFRERLFAEVPMGHQSDCNDRSNGSGGPNGDQRSAKNHACRVVIVGAGSAGALVAKELAAHPEMGRTAVGFIDDDPAKRGGVLNSLPVLGARSELAEIIEIGRAHV